MNHQLQAWMTKHKMRDHQVARLVKRSRVQISRIRRGKTYTSVPTAMRLQKLTGIAWWNFIKGGHA